MNIRKMTAFLGSAAIVLAAGCSDAKKNEPVEQIDRRPRVRVCGLEKNAAFEDAARVQGTVRTKFSASVASRLAGPIDEIMADEGDVVKAGTPLFQIDKVNLENKVRIAQDDRNVAKAALAEATAAEAEAQAAFEKADLDAGRMDRLYNEKKAVTQDAWERAALNLKSAAAALARAKAGVETAKVKIMQAETAFQIAEKNLDDSLGKAPFDGVVTQKLKDKGDYAASGTAIFKMDNPGIYEICFSMNADQYDKVNLTNTVVRLTDGRKLHPSYQSPTVNATTRTFELRTVVGRTPDLAPGMIRSADVVFSSHPGAGVPASAVGLRGGENVVFVVKDGTVAQIPVKTGFHSGGRVEILNPEALKDARIVKDGMLLLNPGDAVIPVDADAKK